MNYFSKTTTRTSMGFSSKRKIPKCNIKIWGNSKYTNRNEDKVQFSKY